MYTYVQYVTYVGLFMAPSLRTNVLVEEEGLYMEARREQNAQHLTFL